MASTRMYCKLKGYTRLKYIESRIQATKEPALCISAGSYIWIFR